MYKNLSIYTDREVPSKFYSKIENFLLKIFPFTGIKIENPIVLPNKCWNPSRCQYKAKCMLYYINSLESDNITLLILSKDMYVPRLNFVFGVAIEGLGAVVSIFRLEDQEFLRKEVFHELGHVFGLKHCSLPCVMTFSNSVLEAKMKSSSFCETCLKKIRNYKKITSI